MCSEAEPYESNDISLTSTLDKDRHSLGARVAEREQGFAVSGPGQQVIVFYANKQHTETL